MHARNSFKMGYFNSVLDAILVSLIHDVRHFGDIIDNSSIIRNALHMEQIREMHSI